MASIEESELTGNTNGTIKIPNYTEEFNILSQDLTNLKTAINDLTDAINNTIGSESLTNEFSLGNSQAQMASIISGILDIAIDGNKKQGNALAALESIRKSISGVATSVNTGVAIQVLQANDQMKKNAFDKEATQQALKRNNIPTVTVSNDAFLTVVQTNIEEGARLFTNAGAIGLVNGAIATSATAVTNYAFDLLPSSADVVNSFKKFFTSSAADPEGQAARALAQTKNT